MINVKIDSVTIDNSLISDKDLDLMSVTKDIKVKFTNRPHVSISHHLPYTGVTMGCLADSMYAKNHLLHMVFRFFNFGL